ncbi:thiol-activated cytolysin C-terminal domain-containing protein [Aliivibrio fischeri]
MNLKLDGAYVAKFTVEWDEIYFDDKGKEKSTRKYWDGNGVERTSLYTTVIPLKANSKNIHIMAQGATGLLWEPWRTSFNKFHIPLVKNRSVALWGQHLIKFLGLNQVMTYKHF